MSAGGDEVQIPSAVAVQPDGPLDLQTALKRALTSAYYADGLAKGLRESAKALDKREAHFALLAENCDEPQYVELIETLCSEHQIPLIKVADKKTIGEYAGLYKQDAEGKARKVVGCSSAVVKNWGNDAAARNAVQNYLNTRQ